jgi:hypothetical protein
VIPTPAQLGVAGAQSNGESAVDWNATHKRLREMGAESFQMERLPQGGVRVLFRLPASQTGQPRRVEAEAATEAEAIRLALERAERSRDTAP